MKKNCYSCPLFDRYEVLRESYDELVRKYVKTSTENDYFSNHIYIRVDYSDALSEEDLVQFVIHQIIEQSKHFKDIRGEKNET